MGAVRGLGQDAGSIPLFDSGSMAATLPSPGTLQLQPLFPLALGLLQLASDPLDTALQMQAIRQLQAGQESNPDPDCAWTGDLNGVWQLHRHPTFAPLIGTLASHAS